MSALDDRLRWLDHFHKCPDCVHPKVKLCPIGLSLWYAVEGSMSPEEELL